MIFLQLTVWLLTGLAIYSYQSGKSLDLLQLLKSFLKAMNGQVWVETLVIAQWLTYDLF